MGVLAKTTGPFVIPLGRGNFVLPDASEVEDCAALRDAISCGKAVLVEVDKPKEELKEEPKEEPKEELKSTSKRNRRK